MKIVFFDGYCSLCNASVDWLIRIDRSEQLKFASLQGQTANELLGNDHAPSAQPTDFDSIVYFRDGVKFDQSTAVLHILSDIGGPWSLAQIFLVVPTFIRDFVYSIIAKNRYRIMSKRDTCRMPTPTERNRLLP